MELLQLILFSFSYSLMNTGTFFYTILIYLFLNLIYKENNILNTNNFDPSMILINFINIILHLLVYQMGLLVDIIKKNQYGNQVFNIYNNINIKYILLKNKLLYYIIFIPTKLVIKKVIKYIDIEDNTNIQLKSNQDINKFLDGLLYKTS
jgi:hypothetical protein